MFHYLQRDMSTTIQSTFSNDAVKKTNKQKKHCFSDHSWFMPRARTGRKAPWDMHTYSLWDVFSLSLLVNETK